MKNYIEYFEYGGTPVKTPNGIKTIYISAISPLEPFIRALLDEWRKKNQNIKKNSANNNQIYSSDSINIVNNGNGGNYLDSIN